MPSTIFTPDSSAAAVLTGLRQQLADPNLDSLTRRSICLIAPMDQLVLLSAILARLDQLVEAREGGSDPARTARP